MLQNYQQAVCNFCTNTMYSTTYTKGYMVQPC